jgi:hypothetical protein
VTGSGDDRFISATTAINALLLARGEQATPTRS